MSAIRVTCPLCGGRYIAGMVGMRPWPRHVCVFHAQQAGHDARCHLCSSLILGYGNLPDRPAHPLETIDLIVAYEGRWVHAGCVEDLGHEVIGP